MDPAQIFSFFAGLGQQYWALALPYVLHFLFGMILLELLVTAITYMMSGGENPAEFVWHLVRLGFRGGFAWWWIRDAWALGMSILASFDMLGSQIAHIPNLQPATLANNATQLVQMLWNAPSTERLVPNFALALAEISVATVILIIFVVIAGLAIFSVCTTLVILGPGSILVAFLPLRFTSDMAQGYFSWVLRKGVIVLFFYLVLDGCTTLVHLWFTTISNVCGATITSLPSPFLGGAATLVTATPCTHPIPIASLLSLLTCAIVLAIIAIGVPFEAGSLVSHGVNMAIEHLATAAYLGKSVGRPVASAVAGLGHQIKRIGPGSYQQFQQRMKAGAQAAANTRPTPPRPSGPNQFGVRPTTPLTNGKSVTSNVTRKLF